MSRATPLPVVPGIEQHDAACPRCKALHPVRLTHYRLVSCTAPGCGARFSVRRGGAVDLIEDEIGPGSGPDGASSNGTSVNGTGAFTAGSEPFGTLH